MDLKYKNKIFFGMALIVLSYFSYALPTEMMNIRSLSVLLFLFIAGIVFLSEGITMSLANRSLLSEIRYSRRNTWSFVIIATIGAIVLDGLAKWSGKLWLYPYYPGNGFFFYLLTFLPGFTAYWLMIVESYFAVKILFDYFYKGKHMVTKPFKHEGRIYTGLGMLGAIVIAISLYSIGKEYLYQKTIFIGIADMKYITSNFKVSLLYTTLISLGLWFVLEYIEYRRKKTSLLKDIIHHYFSPLFALLLGAWLCAVLMESQNIPVGLWVYVNWPLEHLKVFQLPLLVYLVWPVHYLFFLSLFRAFSAEESKEIWQSDLIE